MKQRNRLPAIMLAVSLVVPVSADIIYSNVQLTIPTDVDGISVTIAGGVINPSFGGVVVANDDPIQPFRVGTDGLANILSFGDGVFINGSSGSLATGAGGSFEHVGSTFTAGEERYLGFKLSESNYGWARVVFTNNDTGATFKDWAYDNTGAAIKTGWIKTDIVSGTAQTVTLNSATDESFTLGSSLANASGSITNSLAKTGAGTTVLTKTNTYTGATTVSSGILQIASTGSIHTSSGVTVAAGAKFVYNSSTALAIGLTLNGAGTSNRAVLGGIGPINTSVTLDNLGDTLSPGNSPGIQNYTLAQTWSSFSYDWEVNNFTGTSAGTHFDQIVLGDTLNLSGGSGSYVLNVLGLNAGDVAGDVPNFSEINRTWTILTSTGATTGFNAANWTINTAGFSNADAGAWSLGQVGNNLVLSYAAIPEPSTVLLLGSLSLLFVLRRKRNA